ncbi:MAG: LPD5 domain-containing protein, partial [Xanthomonadales bacterium]|nr:LPD5 domain-containing protein [Xanthomonadales bacterium]
EYPDAYRYDGDVRVPMPNVAVMVDGRWRRLDGKSVDDVVDAAKALLQAPAPVSRLAFQLRGIDSKNQYFIVKKGDAEYHHLKEFTTIGEARAYLKEHHAELVQAWEGVKQRENVTKADMRNKANRSRVGPEYRDGIDVTPEQFADTFGFRGIEFGNWVKQGKNARDRQGMLNQAFDALMDLAAIVGVPPRALSLNGTLGLGLGSRGHGWASAHFESDRLVINLTKTRGAGALAHEWFHALDNYFARSRVEPEFHGDQAAYREQAYVTYRPEPVWVNPDLGRAGRGTGRAQLESRLKAAGQWDETQQLEENAKRAGWQHDPKHPEGVRPVVEKAFAELVQALNASPMAKRAQAIDKGKSDGYWSRIIERAARSFENYVIVKMADQGISNDYLANVVTPGDFKRADARYPYLNPDEIEPVATAFEHLFTTIETREGENGNVVLFSVQSTADDAGKGGLSVAQVEKAIAGIKLSARAGLARNGVEIVVVPDAAAFGPAGAGQEFAGGYYPETNRIVLVASALHSVRAAKKTLLHELVGHFGLNLLPPAVKQ